MAVQLQPSSKRPYQLAAPSPKHGLTAPAIACAAVVGLALGGPLLAVAGLTFMASVMVLIVSSPLLVVFSPLILPACAVLAAAVAGFSAAAAMAFVGLGVLSWMVRYVRGRGRARARVVVAETVTESGQRVKEQTREWDGGVMHQVQVYPPGTDSKGLKIST